MCFSVEIERRLPFLEKRFKAHVDKAAFLALDRQKNEFPQLFKLPGEDDRIFPNYFAPVLIKTPSQRIIYPMRYRIRPAGSPEEIPSRYNLFNARLDSLEKRKTWRPLFGKNHGVLVFKKFYEWVENPAGKKKLVRFFPEGLTHMWSPCLFDHWISGNEGIELTSFALITTDPPAEISQVGHDRCPIFLKEEMIDAWLNPQGRSKKELYEILSQQERPFFGHEDT